MPRGVQATPGRTRERSLAERDARRADEKLNGRFAGLKRVAARAAALVGLPTLIRKDNAVFRERDPISLDKALEPAGPGVKEYDVRFATGETMRLRATNQRIYADLTRSWRLPIYHALAQRIRPGDRVLDLHAGTGEGTDLLAHAVGPTGGVVALEQDAESVRFARRRYPHPHLAWEMAERTGGGVATLRGELDHAFNAAAAVLPPHADRATDPLAELWRTIHPNGTLLLIDPTGADGPDRHAAVAARARAVCGPPAREHGRALHIEPLLTPGPPALILTTHAPHNRPDTQPGPPPAPPQ